MLPYINGMKKRRPSQIIREIVKTLRSEGELSLRALETKLNANNETIKDYALLLNDLGLIQMKKEKKGSKTITKVRINR